MDSKTKSTTREPLFSSATALANYAKRWSVIGGEADKLIVQHGRPFIGIKRPKEYHPRAQKRCFLNALNLAMEKRGTYCEGFAAQSGASHCFHHAWITCNGDHAIDVTLPDAENYLYFGITFRHCNEFGRLVRSRIKGRWLRPIVSDPIDDLLRNFLRDMSIAMPNDIKTS